MIKKIISDADRQQLQDDLNKLTEWSEKWQMLFNLGKCKCLHTGQGNELIKTHNIQWMVLYYMYTTVMEKDLGLTISADMKMYQSSVELQQRREIKFLDYLSEI